jgi:sarcosine oxidase
MIYDCIVIGLGAMGSASLYQLSKTGLNVLGIDSYRPPHKKGSSHGESRVTRLTTIEGEELIPLVKESNKIIKEIESELGVKIITENQGSLIIDDGISNGHGVINVIKTAESLGSRFKLNYSKLSSDQLSRIDTLKNINSNSRGYLEHSSGYIKPENLIQSNLNLALNKGANIKFNEKVNKITEDSRSISVVTDQSRYACKKLVVTVGPWVNELGIKELKNKVKIYRQSSYFFKLKEDFVDVYKKAPTTIRFFGSKPEDCIYVLPLINLDSKAVKIGTESYLNKVPKPSECTINKPTDPKKFHSKYVKPLFYGISDECIDVQSCYYSVTRDQKYIIDFKNKNRNILLVSACSGHGFKVSPAIGLIVKELVEKNKTNFDISRFRLNR